MQTPKPKQPRNTEYFNPEQLVAWEKYRAGLTQKEIAKSFGVNQTTVGRWVKNIQDYMKQCPEYQEALPRIASLIPQALNVYAYHVTKWASLQASKDILKMAGLFVEYIKTENTDTKSRLSEDEIRAKIKELATKDKVDIDQMTKKVIINAPKTAKIPHTLDNQGKEGK